MTTNHFSTNHFYKLLVVAVLSSVVQISSGGTNAFTQSTAKTLSYSAIPAKVQILKSYNDVVFQLSGILRDSCHKKGESLVEVEDNQILIQNLIQFTPDVPCLRFLTPYLDEVVVVGLNSGELYDVLIMDAQGNYHEITTFQMQ
jgi:hypothetical protein